MGRDMEMEGPADEAAGVAAAEPETEALGSAVLGSSSPTVFPSSPTTCTFMVPWLADEGLAVWRADAEMVIVVVEDASLSPVAAAASAPPVVVEESTEPVSPAAAAVTVTVFVTIIEESSLSLTAEAEGETSEIVLDEDGIEAEEDSEAVGASSEGSAEGLEEGTNTRVTF